MTVVQELLGRDSCEQEAEKICRDMKLGYKGVDAQLARRIADAIRAAVNAAHESDAAICDAHARIHREFGQNTWAALAETYAELIRALKRPV